MLRSQLGTIGGALLVLLAAGVWSDTMSEEPRRFTEAEAQRYFAIEFNNTTWELIEKTDRTREETETMVYRAHASCYHWMQVGEPINHARGEYLISRAYAAAGDGEMALRHANRCLEITEANPDAAEDWDRAFACEAVARGHALSGKRAEAEEFLRRAEEAGRQIADDEDRRIFEGELNRQPWNGMR